MLEYFGYTGLQPRASVLKKNVSLDSTSHTLYLTTRKLFTTQTSKARAKRALQAVVHVEKIVRIFLLMIDANHEFARQRQLVVDENEDRLFCWQSEAFANDVDELAKGEVGRHEELSLVDWRCIGRSSLHDDGYPVSIFLQHVVGFGLPLLEGYRVLIHFTTHAKKGTGERFRC